MGARADAVQQTRDRIVAAAMALHAERGVQATGWDDIAAAAGVSAATVYRHFGSLDELIPACAQTVFAIIVPPTLEEARRQFATMDDLTDRFEHLARESAHCYQRGEQWLHAAYRERDFIPALAAALAVIEDTLKVLVNAAADRRLTKAQNSELFVLCNFPLWKQLVDSGLGYANAEAACIGLVRDAVSRIVDDRRT
ncbi:TetR/AcrR family transcriptional regulator [Nocardia aurantiaca]|nr:TetR/AcrR family transcriptional regulator [Nocardia aurantiaca]